MVELAPGWEERKSSSRGIPYYFNTQTGESRWDPPSHPTTTESSRIHAYHLLVKHNKSRRPSSWRSPSITQTPEEALQQIQEYERQIRKTIDQGVDPLTAFKGLASQVSDCSSAKQGGDLGEFGRGQMQKSFEEAAWALQPGELSGPISSDSGLHLIYRVK